MSNISLVNKSTPTTPGSGSGLLKKEDYWAVWIGLGTVILSIILWAAGSTAMPALAVSFPAWDQFSKVSVYFHSHWGGIVALWFCFLVVFSIAVKVLGHNLKSFIPGFTILFILGVIVSILGASSLAKKWSLEPPLMALLVGLILGNVVPLPKWLDTAFRTEFYVKTGIVLMGATLPFTIILQSGPMAFLQATIVAVSTFLTIYWIGTRLFHLDKRFSTALAAGGSICGVSAAIAIGGSVKAEKNHVSVAISLVVVWAIIMVFALPIVIKALGISPGPGGAWIGTSEFADAAGIAAAASISEQAIKTFTLMKVVGRDMFVGIWCFIMALIAVTKWERREDGRKPNGKEIWFRFPKFVLGFFAASIVVTLLIASVDAPTAKTVSANIVGPISMIRLWAFIFTFLCIGLTTRFKELAAVGWRPFAAFTAGVIVNVPLGYILSVLVLGGYWTMVK
ncbi:Uncharacterised protein family UPF0324, prokaryote [Acididesulfobacillus acetoxydans]|uniref:UPF0324 membrane protein RB9488 n=1 Tax=Acididesulfobacillus acetoxydans TaxID=1561005 RepID=A0A8S0W3S3_9FIRM|nr:putative sulfate exporter family transporter [Acididesulfobacillus acetoxydans]CAA7601948.1 Uncharacterised protein family UPF0324, prokaryote [Acididesulfobacillus acetoxydans]CEJ08208.1 UPF0324 membrane protein RB9488 [Acididesulfobacillus acetoxydans]